MIQMQPPPPMSSFNLLLCSVAKSNHYSHVLSMCPRMMEVNLKPDFITLNILLNCCSVKRVSLGLAALGVMYRKGYCPNIVTFTSLIKGMGFAGKRGVAVQLFRKVIRLGLEPSTRTWRTLINGLSRSGNSGRALELHREMGCGSAVSSGGKFETDLVCYIQIIEGLCKKGQVDKAKELFFGDGRKKDFARCGCVYNLMATFPMQD